MLIYIRHSEDQSVDPTYEHDSRITQEGRRLAHKKGQLLLKKYGYPDMIYCSPFRRTRETLKYMLYGVSKEDVGNINIIYDIKAARHFKRRQQQSPDVAEATMKANIPIYEDRRQFRQRVINLSADLSKHVVERRVIWCITHTTVYKILSNIYNVDIPDTIPYMHHFAVKRVNRESDDGWCSKCKTHH